MFLVVEQLLVLVAELRDAELAVGVAELVDENAEVEVAVDLTVSGLEVELLDIILVDVVIFLTIITERTVKLFLSLGSYLNNTASQSSSTNGLRRC